MKTSRRASASMMPHDRTFAWTSDGPASRGAAGAPVAARGRAASDMVLLLVVVEKVWSSAGAAGDAGPCGRVDDVTRQDYFPSSASQDSGRGALSGRAWTLVRRRR